MSDRIPAEVWPLASYIAEELDARGWNSDDLAIRMGYKTDEEYGVDLLSVGFLLSVQDDNLKVGDDLFRKLALAFDVSEQFFRNLDDVWRKHPDRRVEFECPDNLFGPKLLSGFPTEH